jgi:hypothetical protein
MGLHRAGFSPKITHLKRIAIMAGRRGRPPKIKTPTNINEADAADALRRASAQIVEATEAAEAAKWPLKKAKAAVKATGIDFDIFNLVHKIRSLDEDDKRRSRIRKLELTMRALLSDQITPDLFGGLAGALPPESAAALRAASDELGADGDFDGLEFEDGPGGEETAETEEVPFDVADSGAGDGDADPAPVVLAEDMPVGAGAAFNMGSDAYYTGMDEDDCPFGDDEGDAARRALWLRGFKAAEALNAPPAPNEDEVGAVEGAWAGADAATDNDDSRYDTCPERTFDVRPPVKRGGAYTLVIIEGEEVREIASCRDKGALESAAKFLPTIDPTVGDSEIGGVVASIHAGMGCPHMLDLSPEFMGSAGGADGSEDGFPVLQAE